MKFFMNGTHSVVGIALGNNNRNVKLAAALGYGDDVDFFLAISLL